MRRAKWPKAKLHIKLRPRTKGDRLPWVVTFRGVTHARCASYGIALSVVWHILGER